jgi:hypothetical protein
MQNNAIQTVCDPRTSHSSSRCLARREGADGQKISCSIGQATSDLRSLAVEFAEVRVLERMYGFEQGFALPGLTIVLRFKFRSHKEKIIDVYKGFECNPFGADPCANGTKFNRMQSESPSDPATSGDCEVR